MCCKIKVTSLHQLAARFLPVPSASCEICCQKSVFTTRLRPQINVLLLKSTSDSHSGEELTGLGGNRTFYFEIWLSPFTSSGYRAVAMTVQHWTPSTPPSPAAAAPCLISMFPNITDRRADGGREKQDAASALWTDAVCVSTSRSADEWLHHKSPRMMSSHSCLSHTRRL